MQVIKVRNNNRYFKEVINIYYNWWGQKKGFSLSELIDHYEQNLDNDKLPNLYYLVINDTLIGCYEINAKDNIDDEKYTPYLANVFIKEEYRGRHYSSILIEDAMEKTKKLGYDKLYLHSKHVNYYEKYGFKLFKEVKTKEGTKRLFSIDLYK